MPADYNSLAQRLIKNYGDRKIYSVYEAGFSGFGLHRILVAHGIENIIVNPASIEKSLADRVKTDRKDSFKLAKYLSLGLLKGIKVPTIEEELQRQLPRARQQLVKERSRIMVQIRRRLFLFGYHQAHARVLQRRWVKEQILSLEAGSPLRMAIESQLKLWECIALEIRAIEAHLKQQASKCNLELVYRSVPGIGKVSSRILACELGDMKHFKNEKSLFSYIGMTPTENSSGDKIKRGHISRQGKPIIRKVLVEAAWSAIRRDAEIREYYKKLSSRTGGQRAVVAVGRKLIGRARALFRKGENYRQANYSIAL